MSVLIAASAMILLAAALHDVAFRTVPNWMALALAVLAVASRLVQGDLAASLGVGLAVLLVAFWCWRRGWLGGADVKLLAACVMLAPPALAMALLTRVALAGGALAVAYLLLGTVVARPKAARPAGLLARVWRVERYRMHRRGPLPYASAIAAGAVLTLARG